jgi:hypothetical protein
MVMNIQDLPAYKNNQYYNLGSDLATAQAGLDVIESFTPCLNMQRWCSGLSECLDGYYRVPRIPTVRLNDILSQGLISQQTVIDFVETYVISIDDYSSGWFSAAEEV